MALSPKILEDACMVIVFKPACRYHNGAGYQHHPAFEYEVHCGDAESIYPDSLDLKMLDPEAHTSTAINAARRYMHENMAKIIAELIEGEFDGSA